MEPGVFLVEQLAMLTPRLKKLVFKRTNDQRALYVILVEKETSSMDESKLKRCYHLFNI